MFKPQYGNRATPKMDLFASDVWGRLGVTFDATTFADRRLHRSSRRRSAAAIDNQANVEVSERQRQARLQPERSRQPVLPRRSLRRGSQQRQDRRGQRYELEARQRRGRACGSRDGSNVDGRMFFDRVRIFTEHVCGSGGDPAAQPEQSDAREERADQRRRHDGAVERGRSSCGRPRAHRVGGHRLPLDRRRQRRADVRACRQA